MEFSHNKKSKDALAVLNRDVLRIRLGNSVTAITPDKAWKSDTCAFDEAALEDGAILFYPGDSITITF